MIVTNVSAEGARRAPDQLIVEEPLTIQLDGVTVSTTMRTPGHDFELAVGFCHTEGFLGDAPVHGIRYCGLGGAAATRFNVVTVETGGRAPEPTPRLGMTSSSCGWCGSEQLDDLAIRLDPLPESEPFDVGVLMGIPAAVGEHQDLFTATGAVHGAAVFDRSGAIELVREDVGRHNAVDKVIGSMLLDQRLPARDRGLFVSGRASVEMVQKAWSGGFGAVVAVSAPTALAVQAARRAGLMLAGFASDDRLNVYAPERL
jgi:FdhD protein